MLMQANPQDLVSWLLPSAVYQGELNVELQKKHPIFADLLYTIKCAQELSGLLPLLPLTKDGQRREVVEETIECLQQAGKADLLPLAYAFSALTFKKMEQQWLKERFDSMGDILEQSWAYQEMVQKGVAKGLEQGLKQGEQKGLKQGLKQGLEHNVIRFVELHFPDLVPLAKKQAKQAKNPQKLQEMLDHLFVAHTDLEVRAILLGEQK